MTKKQTSYKRPVNCAIGAVTTDTLYVVTGISRLTGEREACSIPVNKPTAHMLVERWKQEPARKRDYLRLRVEPYNPGIKFKNK